LKSFVFFNYSRPTINKALLVQLNLFDQNNDETDLFSSVELLQTIIKTEES
jgi:hypothetical protein